MFEDPSSGMVSNVAQNAPSEAFYPTSMLGNTWFQLQIAQGTGEVKPNPPIMPYVSPEDILYFGSMMNPLTNPNQVLSGSNTGQQVISGTITSSDATQTPRFSMGYTSNGQG